jgi:hypothetical protein
MLVSFASILLLICFLFQLIIDSSYENVLSSIICFTSGIAGLYLSSRIFRGPSLSSIALVGFQASYFWLPLISLTVDVRALTYNLSLPVESFIASSVAFFVLLAAYYLSIHIAQDKSFFLSSHKLNSLFKNNITLSKQSFYTIITLALLVRIFTTGLRLFGRLDFITKIIEPVSIFAALSLACLFFTPATFYLRKYQFRSFPGLVFILTILFTLPSLSRFNILIVIANTLILLATKLFYPTHSALERRKASKFLINIVLAALLLFPILDRVADATAYVRFSGLTVGGPLNTAQRIVTSAIAGDKHIWIPTYTGPYPWDDTYTNSTIFRRFISTNYLDLSLRFHRMQDRDSRALVQDFEVNRIISLVPDPIINIFVRNYDKQTYTLSSFGDYNYFVVSGVGLSGFRTGSLLVSLMALFGLFWPLALFIVSSLVLTFFNLISYPLLRPASTTIHYLHVGPITICLMYEALTVFTSAAGGSESVSRLIELMFRTVPVMAIYFSIFARSSKPSLSRT